MNKRRTWLGNLRFAIVLILWVLGARAEDLPPPTFDSMIGGLLPSGHHSYITESHLELPLFHVEPLTISYRYGETTPFLKENAQAELLYTRYDLEADLKLCDFAQLIAIGGYRGMQLEDRPGSLSAYAVGAGLGSPWRRERAWLEWSVLVGTYLSRERLNADWWADLHAVWIVHQFSERQVIETTNYPALGLALDIESANEDEAFHARYRIGPVLDIVSANGNQIRFQARWYRTDGDPFYQDRDTGLLLGVEVDALLDKDKLFNAREDRPVGLLPLVWGQYNIGYGDERMVEEFELDAEIHDYMIGDHLLTGVLWYQSRQEQDSDGFDNMSYSVSPGVQTPIGLASPLSQGEPLVLGCDYLHRSGHALDPDASRVPVGGFLERSSVNIAPRLRLQTIGWDLPYRDPSMYVRDTKWLNFIDWRVTLGYNFHDSRDRSNPAAQLGMNWDMVTIGGYVIYVHGVGSVGGEIPDWLAECGVRRPVGNLFIRAEKSGLESRLEHGDAVVAGIGFYL